MEEESGLEVISINPHPSYFIPVLNNSNVWKSMVIYETKVKNFDFIASDECQELRFFSVEEAKKENLYLATQAFIKEYDPDNHKLYLNL